MHKKLILAAFEKALDNDREMGISSPSKSKAAEILSEYIEEVEKFQFGERRLRDYYNAALKDEEIELKQIAVRNGLSKYLGFDDYKDFLIRTSVTEKDLEDLTDKEIPENGKINLLHSFLRRNRTTVVIIIGCLIAFLILNSITGEKWMVWEGTQFVETDFDSQKMKTEQMHLLDENQIELFKKIRPNCDTQFFDAKGKAQLWYGKNQNGELEYFTDLGRHPETGKTLKPITRYMIKKYVCGGN